jgi:hypothetical protein
MGGRINFQYPHRQPEAEVTSVAISIVKQVRQMDYAFFNEILGNSL